MKQKHFSACLTRVTSQNGRSVKSAKETECDVCKNDFTTPKILPCGHLPCRECVISWINSKSDASCPLCKNPIEHPQGHSGRSSSDVANTLPTDFAMEELGDNATTLSRNRVCCACDTVGAEYFCMQCQNLLCSPCCKMHKKIPATRSHDVESLSFVTPESLAASRPALCADHGVSVCTACATTNDRSCVQVTDINNEMKSAEESAKHLTDILLMAERELEQSIAEVDKRLQEVNAREQEDIAEVEKVCEPLQKLVEDFRNKMKEISRNSHSEVKKSLHEIKSLLGKSLETLTSHKGIVSRTITVAPNPTVKDATKALEDRDNSLELRADITVNELGKIPSYGTRCHDMVMRREKELQMASKQSTDLEIENQPGTCAFLRKQSGKQRGGNTEVYHLPITDPHFAFLTGKNKNLFQNIAQRTGANVQLDVNPSPVQNTTILIIQGSRSQIEKAVKLINRKTGIPETISSQAQIFWLQWVEAAFPDIESRAYFLPPVYFNRVPMTRQSSAGQEVLVLHEAPGQILESTPEQACQRVRKTQATLPSYVLDSDARDDAAMQRVIMCLQEMSEKNEVLVGLSQLKFGQYLAQPCYAAAADYLPLPNSLPGGLSQNKQGAFDVLLVHRHYGLVVCEVKSIGDNVKKLNMSQLDLENIIRKKLKHAVSQLDKADAMLSHLVSDIAPGLRITKTIAFPNLRASQVQQAIFGDLQLTQVLARCLGTTDPADIPGLCLCSDQLSDPRTPWDVPSDVLRELGTWWQRRVAVFGPDSHMTCDVYKTLVARFCGPATTVTVPCTSYPPLCVKTLGQAVSLTGECYTAHITLFPEQVHLLNMPPFRVFLAGPPGTGKTVVLLLIAIQWLRCGNDVYIVSTWWGSRAACTLLFYLMQQTVNSQKTEKIPFGKPRLLRYKLTKENVEEAVNDLSQEARGGSLYVIADEAEPVDSPSGDFKTFCNKLLIQVPSLHLWAASCYHSNAPSGWQVENLTRPLRSPPAVVREIQRDFAICVKHTVQEYSERGVSDHTDGPPVRRLYHQGHGHLGLWPRDCVACGFEVAIILDSLRVGVPVNVAATSSTVTTTSGDTTPPCLQWRDVLVLCWHDVNDQSGVVTGLRQRNIPVRVMKDDDTEDVATARSDVVWVACGRRVLGLERKVVVCLVEDLNTTRVHFMSRCTSQLVIVSR